MKQILVILTLVCVALVVMASAVTAENAPPWRGQANTTNLDWNPQDVTFNYVGTGLYGGVSPSVIVGTNYLSVNIPNFVTDNPLKLMRIQVWWDFGGQKPTFDSVNGIFGYPGMGDTPRHSPWLAR